MSDFKRPGGDITTLLDLVSRDRQDNDFFPLNTNETWFTRDPDRRLAPSVPFMADFPFRGPASFGQRFTFDIGSVPCGDMLLGTVLQVKLGHWLDLTTRLFLQSGRYRYKTPEEAWFYANSLGTCLVAKAELEIDGKTIEEFDGDFSNVFACLYPDYNSQIGIGADHLGRSSIPKLLAWDPSRIFPVEDGAIHCILPFFFGRQRLLEALPMIAIKEGSARIHVTLRPFSECVRQLRGFRESCDAVPLEKVITFEDTTFPYTQNVDVNTAIAEPGFESVRLLTFGSILDGPLRETMLRQPFEILHREVQTFSFTEPLKYIVAKNSSSDTIRIQLPLEANHPLEEIVWFLRRKGARDNNEWVNYSSVLESEYDPIYKPLDTLLVSAVLQVNGVTICDAEEGYYRNLIAKHHRGGIVPWQRYVYGYPFARWPGEHQPSGTLNASRVQNLRLTLEVKGAEGIEWEVKVYCIGLNWLRFQNGLANPIFED